jgi:hypothetical protein
MYMHISDYLYIIEYRTKTRLLKPSKIYLHNNLSLPIYSTQPVRLSTTQIATILLDENEHSLLTCSSVPTCVEINAVFVVDLAFLRCIRDLYCDDMGSWKSNGKYSCVLEVTDDGFVNLMTDDTPFTHSMYRLKKKYFKHGTAPDLRKTVVLMEGLCVYND